VIWYRGGLVFDARVSLDLRLKDLLGPVTRVKKKEKNNLHFSGKCAKRLLDLVSRSFAASFPQV